MPRLERLTLEHFRGASSLFDLAFDDKPLVVIFGENGTGKTTIVDGLDALGNCFGGSLKFKSSTSLKTDLPTKGKSPRDMRIELMTGGTVYRAALKGNDIVVTPPECPPIWILRRASVLQFIEARPAERYKSLQHLIGVEGVETSEEALKRAAADANDDLNAGAAKITASENLLAALWEEEGRPGRDWRAWADGEASTDAAGLLAHANQLRATREAIETLVRAFDDLEQAEARLADADRQTTEVAVEFAADSGVDTSASVRLVELLDRAEQVLADDPTRNDCPVCRQPVSVFALRAALAGQRAEFARFRELSRRRRDADDTLLAARSAATTASDALLAAARHVLGIEADAFVGPMIASTGKYRAIDDDATEPEIAISLAVDLAVSCLPLVQRIRAEEDAVAHAEGRLNSIKVSVDTVVRERTALADVQETLAGLRAAHDIVRATRLVYTQDILDTVGKEAADLYAKVHPRERINVASIVLDPAQRASIKQTVTFEGYDVAPQAYLSEAHLDTLGFCFWLALAKRELRRADMVLVLDDVFTSVDAPHLRRLSELIVEESEHFAQLVIATHQRSWRDFFSNAYGPAKHTQMVELQRWTFGTGIRHAATPPAVAELASALAAERFDRQAVGSKAGILLEATLDRLAIQYRQDMPRTIDNLYTLADLLNGTEKRLKRLEVHRPALSPDGSPFGGEANRVKLETFISPLRLSMHIRNQVGAHFNLTGADISDAEVYEFGETTVRLVQALACDRCGALPTNKHGNHHRCACTHGPWTELHPC